jgi:hypothetical protein
LPQFGFTQGTFSGGRGVFSGRYPSTVQSTTKPSEVTPTEREATAPDLAPAEEGAPPGETTQARYKRKRRERREAQKAKEEKETAKGQETQAAIQRWLNLSEDQRRAIISEMIARFGKKK